MQAQIRVDVTLFIWMLRLTELLQLRFAGAERPGPKQVEPEMPPGTNAPGLRNGGSYELSCYASADAPLPATNVTSIPVCPPFFRARNSRGGHVTAGRAWRQGVRRYGRL